MSVHFSMLAFMYIIRLIPAERIQSFASFIIEKEKLFPRSEISILLFILCESIFMVFFKSCQFYVYSYYYRRSLHMKAVSVWCIFSLVQWGTVRPAALCACPPNVLCLVESAGDTLSDLCTRVKVVFRAPSYTMSVLFCILFTFSGSHMFSLASESVCLVYFCHL